MGRNRAFTLIELLVVIAIIAILAGILFPVFAAARRNANKAVCLTHMSETGKAFLMYVSDYDDRAVTLCYRGGVNTGHNLGFWGWSMLTLPYAKSYQVYLCPSDVKDDIRCGEYGGRCRDPNNMLFGYFFSLFPSWGYNYFYFASPLDPYAPDDLDGLTPQSLKGAVHPASTVVFAESTELGTAQPGGFTGSDIGYLLVKPPHLWRGAPPLDGTSYGNIWPRHHPDQVNVLFLDGHEKTVTLSWLSNEDVWKLR